MVVPSATLSQTLNSENFTSTHRPSLSAINSDCGRAGGLVLIQRTLPILRVLYSAFTLATCCHTSWAYVNVVKYYKFPVECTNKNNPLETNPPQSNLRRARRSSANKTSSKLLGSHSPSMLSPFKTSLAKWHSARLSLSAYASVCQCTLSRSKMSGCYSYSLHGRIAMLRLFCCVFALEFLFNPQFDLWGTFWDHPRRVFGGVYHHTKFGWNCYSSFDNTKVWMFCACGWKMPIRAPFGDVLKGKIEIMDAFCIFIPPGMQ